MLKISCKENFSCERNSEKVLQKRMCRVFLWSMPMMPSHPHSSSGSLSAEIPQSTTFSLCSNPYSSFHRPYSETEGRMFRLFSSGLSYPSESIHQILLSFDRFPCRPGRHLYIRPGINNLTQFLCCNSTGICYKIICVFNKWGDISLPSTRNRC